MVDYVNTNPNLANPHQYGPFTMADMIYDSFASERGAFITDGTLATTTVAAPLSALSIKCSQVLVQNDPDSTTDILVGNGTSQSIQLKPGDSQTIAADDVSHIYVKAVSGTPSVNWQARN